MANEALFEEWLKTEAESSLLDWLKQASEKERLSLVPAIKKWKKYYEEYVTTDQRSYSSRGTTKQHDMLGLASYVCFPKAEYLKGFRAFWIIDPEHLSKVKDWYHPDWFSELLNKEAESESMVYTLQYELVLQLMDEGRLQPSHRLLARTLIPYIFEQQRTGNKWWHLFKPALLLKRPDTLHKHFWYLFEEESDIYMAERYKHFGENADLGKIGWIPAITQLAAEGRIDRPRLLQESLLAANKNFNKNLSGWFMELFTALFPTAAELKELQQELFGILNSPHSKVVNQSLQFLKQLSADKGFDMMALEQSAPVLLSSKTKTTVTAGLMLLEQTAKKHTAFQSQAAILCTQALVHADEGLQTRAARIIVKYGSADPAATSTSLLSYRDGLLSEAATILKAFLGNEQEETTTSQVADSAFDIAPNDRILVPQIQNTDELLFLAAQAFDNNDALHIDLFPDALLRWQHELKGSLLSQLQPALQRALQLIRSGLRSNQGSYDHMLAVFFIDIAVHLSRKFPSDARELIQVFEKFNQQDGQETRKWMNIEESSSYIQGWSTYYKDPFYEPRKYWLYDVLQKFKTGNTLPLLSTPTHYPGLIDPLVLVQRVLIYQERDQLPDQTDLWMAMGRVELRDLTAARELVHNKIRGEWKNILLFLLSPGAAPEGEISQPEAWFMALLSHHPKQLPEALRARGYIDIDLKKYTGQWDWQVTVEEFERSEYKWEGDKMKTIKVKDHRKSLLLDEPVSEAEPIAVKTVFRNWLGKLTGKEKPAEKKRAPLLYEYYDIRAEYFSNEHNDIRRALLMAPDNAEALLPAIVRSCMRNFEYIGEGQKKMLVAVLQFLHESWQEQGEMAHLVLATSLIYPDKTVAQMAAEIWLQYAPTGKIDSTLLGKILGKQEVIEIAPLKRFNDLAVQSLFRISAQHNRLLETMIASIIAELPAEPIKHLKKLLELYKELFLLNQTFKVPDAVAVKLKEWKLNNGLVKLVEGLGRVEN